MTEIDLERYADELFGGEDDLLREMREEAERLGLPTIQVPPELARLLAILIAQTSPTSVLEIGTLFGYSSVVMGRALGSSGRITSLEVNAKHASLARRNFERAGIAGRVEVLVGAALELLPSLADRTFDFVFIDADKQSYPAYLDWALRLTRAGAIIVADNVWRGGSVLESAEGDAETQGLAQFNRELAQHAELLSTFVPTRGGQDAASLSVVRQPA